MTVKGRDDYEWNLAHWDDIDPKDKNPTLPDGITVTMFWNAVLDNEKRVKALLGPTFVSWSGDVMCRFADEALRAAKRWAAYEQRKPLAAFFNTIAKATVNEWIDRERPKHRGGMTNTPKLAKPAPSGVDGDEDAQRRANNRLDRLNASSRFDTGDDVNQTVDDDGTPRLPVTDHNDYETWRLSHGEDMLLDRLDHDAAGTDAAIEALSDAWAPNGSSQQTTGRDLTETWNREFQALKAAVNRRYRRPEAWDAIARRATGDTDPDSTGGRLRRELGIWILTCRKAGGRVPSLDDYPIITDVCDRAIRRLERKRAKDRYLEHRNRRR